VGGMGYKRSLGSSFSLCYTLVGKMRPGGSLGFALFCWVFGEVVAYSPWGFLRGEAELWGYGGDLSSRQLHAFPQPSPWVWVDVSQLQAASLLHPVAVQCQEAQVVVTVHRDLFGTGRLVKAAELTLGPAACLPVVWSAAETTVTFMAGLHECGSTLRVRLWGGWSLGVRVCLLSCTSVPRAAETGGGLWCSWAQGNALKPFPGLNISACFARAAEAVLPCLGLALGLGKQGRACKRQRNYVFLMDIEASKSPRAIYAAAATSRVKPR